MKKFFCCLKTKEVRSNENGYNGHKSPTEKTGLMSKVRQNGLLNILRDKEELRKAASSDGLFDKPNHYDTDSESEDQGPLNLTKTI